ncbi:MAG: hypothetical protein JSS63_15020 [Bacteroidetes bacterium]|nr:hypothetical protein [Bacteroidota bacterium]
MQNNYLTKNAVTVSASNSAFAASADFICDGTNDQVEINAAIAALNQGSTGIKGTVYLYAGDYFLSDKIFLKSSIDIIGMNKYDTRLQAGFNGAPVFITVNNSFQDTVVQFSRLSNFTIQRNYSEEIETYSPPYAIYGWFDHCVFEKLRLDGFSQAGISLNPDNNEGLYGYVNIVQECEITNNPVGIYMNEKCFDSYLLSNNIGSSSKNIVIAGGPIRILHNHLDGNSPQQPDYNIYSDRDVRSIVIANNIIENAKKGGVYITRDSKNDSDPNYFTNVSINSNLIRSENMLAADTYNYIDFVSDGNNPDMRNKGIAITGNLFEQRQGNVLKHAINLENCDNCTITGNDFSIEGAISSYLPLIKTTNCTDVQICSNANYPDPNVITEALITDADYIQINNSKFVGSSSSSGKKGQICYSEGFLYICVGTNHWQRVEIKDFLPD